MFLLYIFVQAANKDLQKYEARSIILLDIKEENWYQKTNSNKATAPIIIGSYGQSSSVGQGVGDVIFMHYGLTFCVFANVNYDKIIISLHKDPDRVF